MKVKNKDKTKKQLIDELAQLYQRLTELEAQETEHKQAEDKLRESEEKYRELAENINEVIYAIDENGTIGYVSPAITQFTEYDPSDLIGRRFSKLVHPEDRQKALDDYQRIASGHVDITEYRLLTKSGDIRWIRTSSRPLFKGNSVVGMRGVMTDITERKQAEETLRQSEERYRTILDDMGGGYYETDIAGNLTFVNDAICRILGYSRQEAIGMNNRAYMDKENAKLVYKIYNKVYRSGKPAKWFSWELICKNGERRFVEISVYPLSNEAGEIIGFRGICNDITERKQAEEALRQSEERYRTILDEMEDSYFEVDLAGNYTFVNDANCRLLGYSREELTGMSYRAVTPGEGAKKLYQDFNSVYRTGKPMKGISYRFVPKDGSAGFGELSVFAQRNREGDITGFRGIGRDVTERKQMEQKAQLESRLATVGLLASGVGHEINNPLTGVIGYSQLLLEKDIPEDIKEDVKTINEGAQRVANIVKKLVAFARYQKPERTCASINGTLATTLDLLAHQLNTSNIETNLHVDPNLPWTVADIGQLQQVFLNLVINAETEMRLAHGKGKLSIKTEKTDNTIRICFQDDGPGIAEENVEKIFDPFFTTREVGQGTGLGLSICHEIITEHGGSIYVQSKPGNGATFIVELPVVAEEEQAQAPEPVAEEAVKVSRARVLVVDDEPVILAFVSRVLTDEGHEVETVDNAEDALGKIKSERYGLILLDMKLPGMRGDELYKHIQRIARSLARRVVFITGDVLGAETIDFLTRTEAPYVAKPFNAEQLKKAVNRILAEDR